MEMRDRERNNLLAVLESTKWKISGPSGAAEKLGVKPSTMAYRMKSFGLEKPR
jgi:transcriptional regulator with GAF, ATPase, and Fis domain